MRSSRNSAFICISDEFEKATDLGLAVLIEQMSWAYNCFYPRKYLERFVCKRFDLLHIAPVSFIAVYLAELLDSFHLVFA